MMLWLYLHFPRLQLDYLHQAQQSPPPCIIVDGQQHQVAQLCTQAREAGIQPGMRLSAAVLLCPNLNVVSYQQEQEQRKLQELAQQIYTLVANISLKPPKGLLLEISSMLKLYGNLQVLSHSLKQFLQRQQLTVSMACAYQPLSARIMAEASQGMLTDDESQLESRLHGLAIQHLLFDSKSEAKLTSMGITSVRQLINLNRAELAQRFGKSILLHLDKLSGRLAEPQQFYQPPAHFQASLDFMHEVSNSQMLTFPLNRVLQQLSQFLHKRQLVTGQLALTLIHRDQSSSPLSLSLAQGEDHPDKLRDMLMLHIQQQPLKAPVMGLSIQARQLSPKQQADKDLFCNHGQRDTPAQLLQRLQAKCGNQRIRGMQLHDEHRPEHAFSLCKPLEPSTSHTTSAPRPSLLLPRPKPLPQRPHILAGPERIQTGWWDHQPVCRDYYVAQNAQQQRCWVYRQADGRWFIHGYFS